MTWLLILFIVFVALAPLITLMPTRAQKKLARLRQHAAVIGLQVQLREPPGRTTDKRLQACYGLRAPHRKRLPVSGAFAPRDGSWHNIELGGAELPASFRGDFPAGVSYLQLAPDQVVAFWDEQGEEADIEQIQGSLEALIESCLSAHK